MATQPDDDNPNILDLTDALDEPTEPQPGDQDEPQREEGDEPDTNVNDEGGDTPVVSFDGEEPEPEAESTVIREFRKREREKDKRIAELERQVAPKPVEVGPKPELWSDEIAGDEALYDKRMDEWRDQKAASARQSQAQAEETRRVQEAWQNDLSAFEQKKAALQFDDRDDAIESARSSLDLVQQAVVVKAAADPALFLYALSKSEAKRAEIAKIDDPIKLAAAIARMEGAVKVTNRKAPAPDRPERGSAQMPGGADKTHANLTKEAERTGDYTKLLAYEREQGQRK